MATSLGIGGQILTDGLVLCLDAANKDSYPGSGTTWTDLTSQGADFALVNSPTFTSSNLGGIVLDGTNTYMHSNGNFFTADYWSDNGPFTVSSFHKITGDTTGNGRSAIFANQRYSTETNNGGPGGFGVNIYAGNYVMNLTHDDGQGTTSSYQNINYVSIVQNEIVHITYTWNPSTSTVLAYKNGVQVNAATSNSYKWSTRSIGLDTRIGTSTQGGWGYYFPGEIYTVSVYNRTLSASEVLSSYKTTKARFRL